MQSLVLKNQDYKSTYPKSIFSYSNTNSFVSRAVRYDDIHDLTIEKRLSFHITLHYLFRSAANCALYCNIVLSSTEGANRRRSEGCQTL